MNIYSQSPNLFRFSSFHVMDLVVNKQKVKMCRTCLQNLKLAYKKIYNLRLGNRQNVNTAMGIFPSTQVSSIQVKTPACVTAFWSVLIPPNLSCLKYIARDLSSLLGSSLIYKTGSDKKS